MSKIDDSYKRDVLHNGDYRVSNNGDLLEISGVDNVKQRMMHMLITVPGTIVHHPEWGIGIKTYVNKIGSISVQQDLALRVKDNFEADKDIQEVSKVQIQNQGEGKFILTVSYIIEAHGLVTLEVPIL